MLEFLSILAALLGGVWYLFEIIRKFKSKDFIEVIQASTHPLCENEKIVLRKQNIVKVADSPDGYVGKSIVSMEDGTEIYLIETKEDILKLLN